MGIEEAVYEAITNGAAVVFYQTEQGIHVGVIEGDAITEALAKKDPETGEDWYASGMVCFEKADLDNIRENVFLRLASTFAGVWNYARDIFLRNENNE
jgi:hypothetical protein